MNIIYKDGGKLNCSQATVGDDGLWVDDIYFISYDELKEIKD